MGGQEQRGGIGARESRGEWLLFTDADAVQESDSAARALEIARRNNAAMVSFSPEQMMETWYEKAAIPYVYLRLGSRFRFAEVNDPDAIAAAANGQFILIRRDVYDEVGGHASVAANVLEDVGLATRVKQAGHRIWFGSGRVSCVSGCTVHFPRCGKDGRKTFSRLWGGTPQAVISEWHERCCRYSGAVLQRSIVPLASIVFGHSGLADIPGRTSMGRVTVCNSNAYPFSPFPDLLDCRRVPVRSVLWASYRSHRRGRLEWKGRAYPADTPGASKG